MTNIKKPIRIGCIGEAMVELSLGSSADAPPGLGYAGDSLNTAIYLKRLLQEDAEVAFISKIGHDPLSARLAEFVASESINTSYLGRSDKKQVGIYAIATDSQGERTFSYWRNDSAARALFQSGSGLDFSSLDGFDVLLFSAITLAILPDHVRQALVTEFNRLRQEKGTTVVFDSNYRPALWESQRQAQQSVTAAWSITDIALPSVDDEMALFNDTDEAAVVSRLKTTGVTNGAIKRGELGPMALDSTHTILQIDTSTPITVVDTTAAGDSFNAGYLSAALRGSSSVDAMLAGHQCACRVIACAGAIIPAVDW